MHDINICLHQLFEKQANLTPETVAVMHPTANSGHRELTYEKLNQKANQLAHYLQKIGAGPDKIIAISMERSIDMIIAVLAALKSGSCYLPLDPNYPKDRLSFMLEDANASILLTQNHLLENFPGKPNHVFCINSDWDKINNESKENPTSKVTPSNLAYVIYTSGSTGQPKGVMLEHYPASNLMAWQLQNSTMGAGSRTLQFVSLSFDPSVQELFATWSSGGTLVLVDEEIVRDSTRLLKYIEEHKVERLFLPFVALQGMAEAAHRFQLYPHSLKEISTGGEQLQTNRYVTNFFAGLKNCTLENQYGPTEACILVTTYKLPKSIDEWISLPPIGRAITNVQTYILDHQLQPVPDGERGELYIGGIVLARGYLNQPELTSERFITDPFSKDPKSRLYKTGDLVCYSSTGNIEYLGRIDHQIKIRGFRVELGEIETALANHPSVKQAVVLARENEQGDKWLIAYLTTDNGKELPSTELRDFLSEQLPEYMVPVRYTFMESMPKTPNGKVDHKALPDPGRERPQLNQEYIAPHSNTEIILTKIWSNVLEIDNIGIDDNFFELGGNSLLAHRVASYIQEDFEIDEQAVIKLFQYSTISTLAQYLDQREGGLDIYDKIWQKTTSAPSKNDRKKSGGIAIIGMAGRFPGADTINQLWQNLCDGKESISFFDELELDPGVDDGLKQHPGYVKARGIVNDADKFDAKFFGINPREAEIIDPQQRVFLETAWTALEDAGYTSDRFKGSIGVYAGVGNNTYYLNNVLSNPDIVNQFGEFQVTTLNEKDYVATRTAFKLNLTGPAVSIHSACSTSLVAISHAFHSLMGHECDMALAGGCSLMVPQNSGYIYQEGGMLSDDGHTRPFDKQAKGTVFGNGSGAIVLKRLEDAQKDNDHIYAVIRGAATNNDGANKMSFTAPSIEGQAHVIAKAQACAGIEPETISYIETHGTATPLGDPIEIEALTQAFRARTDAKQFCAIGSIKSNIGHAVTAAGVAGLITTALSLQNRKIPPTLYYTEPNPNIDFENSPFFVNNKLTEWQSNGHPLRAGVSSFGVGGTNAHVVLEEAPDLNKTSNSRPFQLLLLSSKTETALDKATDNLADYFQNKSDVNLADAAYSLQFGRQYFKHRRFVVCQDLDDATQELKKLSPKKSMTRITETRDPEIVFMFPGQGAQYVNMGLNLYEHEPLFRETIDQCAEILKPHLKHDIRDIIYPKSEDTEKAVENLKNTFFTQPALFTLEYALAKLWQSWGVIPKVLIGHSIGEYVAACIAGVFSLEDGLALIAARGSLIKDLPGGSMLSVRSSANKIESRLNSNVSMAAVNGPSLCVVAGPFDEISEFQSALKKDKIASQLLQTSHAFHSSMMDPAVEKLAKRIKNISLSAPSIPIVSTVTGDWMLPEQATDPKYWAKHMRATVRFADAIQTIWQDPQRVLLEAGPGTVTATLAKQQAKDKKKQVAISSLSDKVEDNSEWMAILKAVGNLWLNGVTIDWDHFYSNEIRRRIPLPTYPFERKRYWIDPLKSKIQNLNSTIQNDKVEKMPEQKVNKISRKEKLIPELEKTIEYISGIEINELLPDTTFMEMGLDSLALTQVALTIQNEYKVSLAFRQLMEDYTSLDTLASWLDQELPPDVMAEEEIQSPEIPQGNETPAIAYDENTPITNIPGSLEHVITQQLQIIARQLELMGSKNGLSSSSICESNNGHDPVSTQSIQSSENNKMDKSPGKQQSFGAAARINRTKDNSLSPIQKKNLDALIQQYTKRTEKSKKYTETHRSHLADPRVVSGFNPVLKEMVYPVVAARSSGSRIWDLDGNEYVDLTNGFGSNFFGYLPPFIKTAISNQLDKGMEIGPQTPLAGEVAELITEFTGMERVAFCNTGSEAVLGAMRLARTVSGKNVIAMFNGDYHGIFDEVIVRGTQKLNSIPAAPGIPHDAVKNILVLQYDDPESIKILHERKDELAAVMIEPVQGRHPDLQPKEFIHKLRQFTKEYNIAFIIDEIITGFRVHPGGAQAIFEVKADISTYGKVVGGGMPIGVIAGQSQYMDGLDGGTWQFGDDSIPEVGVTYFAGTFVRHPLTLAAAKAALQYLKEGGPKLQENLNEKTDNLVHELNTFCQKENVPIHLPNFGSLFLIKYAPDLTYGELLFYKLRNKGIHAWDHRPCFLTLAHTDEDIKFIIETFKQSVLELKEAGFAGQQSADEQKQEENYNSSIPPVPGARLGRAPDGSAAWYVPDPDRKGKYLKVVNA